MPEENIENQAGGEVEEKTSAEILRERREAAMGGPAIDREIHQSLPLTRLFYPLFGLTVAAFLGSRAMAAVGSVQLENMAAIAATLLFLVSFVVWFISRHQAKKLTDEKYAEQREALRAAAEEREERAKAEKAAKKAARRRRRSGK